MEKKNTNIIFITSVISFLDSLCYGLIMPVLATQILNVGGNHKILGALVSTQAVLQCLSKPLTKTLLSKYGNKITLLIQLFIGLTSHLMLGYSYIYWQLLLLRCVYYGTNQTQTLCKNILNNDLKQKSFTKLYFILGTLDTLGYIIGPIIGGYLFELNNGFLKITQFTVLSLLLSITLAFILENEGKPETSFALTANVKDDLISFVKKLNYCKSLDYIDLFTVPVLVTVSLTTFFTKYSYLLRTHYQSSASMIGYTVAFHSTSIFIVSCLNSIIKQIVFKRTNNIKLFLLGLLTAMICVCFSKTYELYLLSFVFLSIMQNIIQISQNEFCLSYSKRDSEDLIKSMDSLSFISSIITPICLGIYVDYYGHYAIKAFSVFPIIFTLLILYTKQKNVSSTFQKVEHLKKKGQKKKNKSN